MKKHLLHIVLFFCITQHLYSQEDGVVAFNIPVRNSLKFNRHIVNPTFSFVREQNKYISFNNKREWAQFDDAPQTYLFGYSGRFRENIGAGVSLFQQNYGVLTTFGGVLNFAYNAVLSRDSNLTFGVNLGFYKSGINEGSVITNFPDASLDNFPSNSIITINPGINYGTGFLDFGVSINNLVSYNLTTSNMIENNPEQSVQGHIMYTGYLNSRGFFDESRFSGLVRSEFQKDQTVISGLVMLMVPKGIWGQAGYNTLYGLSAGVGLNITSQIAIEYNYEKAIGDLSSFGNSHDITVAFKFNNRERYDYSGDDAEEALLISSNKKTGYAAKRRNSSKTQTRKKAKPVEAKISEINSDEIVTAKVDNQTEDELANKKILEEQAKLAEVERIKDEGEAKVKQEAEALLKEEQEEQARIAEAAIERAEEEAKAKQIEDARVKAQQEEQARIAEAARIEADKVAKAKLAAEALVKAQQEEQTRIAETARVKAEEEKIEEEKEEKIGEIALDEVLIEFKKSTEAFKNAQESLLDKLSDKIASKNQDLNELKEENDLSEQGIYKAPKAFKSVSAENAVIESLKLEIDNSIILGETKISEIEALYRERLKKVKSRDDSVNVEYLNTIQALKSEQQQAINIKQNLISTLDDIKEATDFERRRRIKRAAYDNEDDRYNKDRATLERIKNFTNPSTEPLTKEDFDTGEALSNIEIVKDVNNVEAGYYLVVAVHNDVSKRDEFLEKAVAAGQKDINFFFNVNTNKYYIYYEKFDYIGEAKASLDTSIGSKPYNGKMSMVKIEN
ncbi:PorP/SprF family type IX secretion system membrane protein [uncultured Algibacter sp.]|uniref:PorP/SprF family type IX secretion system membrane protein n=1 Tax=uncultured Algibacter sp. TaxID=298659 RepID=UPI0025FE0181|nr:PorP/SprF family type IX secretion system membrane protein [uncultured Algibacter sp.]